MLCSLFHGSYFYRKKPVHDFCKAQYRVIVAEFFIDRKIAKVLIHLLHFESYALLFVLDRDRSVKFMCFQIIQQNLYIPTMENGPDLTKRFYTELNDIQASFQHF